MTHVNQKYMQLAGEYRDMIMRGTLQPGERFPSRKTFAEMHGIAGATAARVFTQLINEGLIIQPPGNRAAVVADVSNRVPSVEERTANAKATGRALREDEVSVITFVGEVPCPVNLASYLNMRPGDPVWCRRRVNLINGEPAATGMSYYPQEVIDLTPELTRQESIPSGSRELACERMNSRADIVDRETTGRLATPEEREILHLEGEAPVVIQTLRVVVLEDGRVVEVALKIHEGSRPIRSKTKL